MSYGKSAQKSHVTQSIYLASDSVTLPLNPIWYDNGRNKITGAEVR